MKKIVFLLIISILPLTVFSQARGTRIGYIDMEYILQNVPEYTEANNQLEEKTQKWKVELETKKNEINTLKESLKNEKILLTKELIEEREEEILYLETELSEYQQKRFGPNGDFIIQKAILVKPIQDQVFTAIQDIAEARKFDMILDKSSDLTILFAAKNLDISDLVVRTLTRSAKREQLSKKQQKTLDEQESKEDEISANPALTARKKAIDEKKAAYDKIQEEKKAAAAERKKLYDEKRQKMLDERAAKKNGTVSDNNINKNANDSNKTAATEEENKQGAIKAPQDIKLKTPEERKQEIEDRKKKIIADREAAKKAREEKLKKEQEEKKQLMQNNN